MTRTPEQMRAEMDKTVGKYISENQRREKSYDEQPKAAYALIAKLYEAEREEVVETLRLILDLAKKEEDYDFDDGRQIPNDWAKIAERCRETLAKMESVSAGRVPDPIRRP